MSVRRTPAAVSPGPPPEPDAIENVKGVGPARAALLRRLGLHTARDVLRYYPRDYRDRRTVSPIASLVVGTDAVVKAAVTAVSLKRFGWRRSVVSVSLSDGSGEARAVWFNQPYVRDDFRKGKHVILSGRVGRDPRGNLQFANPEHEVFDPDEEPDAWLHTSRLVPIYPLTEGIGQRLMRRIVATCLEQAPPIREVLPESVCSRHGLMAADSAVRTAHFPPEPEAAEAARRRLIYEELFLLQMGIALRRRAVLLTPKGHDYLAEPALSARFVAALGFALTAAQRRVLDEIEHDLRRPHPMNRLLQGDVGSGKTVVAVWAALRAVESGFQAALMAPTEVLAAQHFERISLALRPLGVEVALLSGALTPAERKRLRGRIASGAIPVVVGTHALFQEGVKFDRLGLAVIDEQHKFGVMQRLRLLRKGASPDVLVMTATPIPRTLALTIYGDMDVSVLDEMPPGRQPVRTKWLREKALPKAYDFVAAQVGQGRQAFLIYPLVDESDKVEWKAATAMYEGLRAGVFRRFRLGLVHGALSADEKDRVMRRFHRGEIDILVATTVIEVGLDVPNATVMLIENAHRFGLAQLHQLRGRIGRGPYPSACLAVASPSSAEARERLRLFEQTSDGFAIGEADLRLRGAGEFFGTLQHGLVGLHAADLVRDAGVLAEARADAFDVVEGDLSVSDEERARLRSELRRLYGGRFPLVSA